MCIMGYNAKCFFFKYSLRHVIKILKVVPRLFTILQCFKLGIFFPLLKTAHLSSNIESLNIKRTPNGPLGVRRIKLTNRPR